MIATRPSSETRPAAGPLDRRRLHARVRARARGGRLRPRADRLLLGRPGRLRDRRRRLRPHRAPRRAARPPPRLRRADRGRSQAGHARPVLRRAAGRARISGGSDADQRRDGDFLDHDARYRRTDEYLEILRAVWTADAPVRSRGRVLPLRGRLTPRCGCVAASRTCRSTSAAPRTRPSPVAGRHADVYALWGEPLDAARPTSSGCRRPPRRTGARCGFSLSLRPILGATEEEAWERPYRILDRDARQRRRAGLRDARARRTWARSACSRPRPRATSSTRACSPPIAERHRRRGQLDGAGRHGRAGGGGAAALRRHRRHHLPHPRLRPARGRARLRRRSSGSCVYRTIDDERAPSWICMPCRLRLSSHSTIER